jgi:signal transduction histidine kinase
MLHNFILEYRDQITDRAAVLSRPRDPLRHPEALTGEIQTFLTEVSETLSQGGGAPAGPPGSSRAARNGANLLRSGLPIIEAVQSYGDVCQAVTALAAESRVPISADEFCVFNRCLDDAIGHAVSEYNRVEEETRSLGEIERLGVAAHELRDQLQTAQLSLRALQMTGEGINGAAGQMLDRALGNLSVVIERTLSDVRLAAGVNRRDSIDLVSFLREVAATAQLHAEDRGVTFTLDAEISGCVEGDRQLLMSAVMNLVHNALKFTKLGGDVRLTARTTAEQLSIAVQDECGGLPDHAAGIFSSFTDRRGVDRSGLGLGLSIAKKVIRSHAGTIAVRNLPGTGCVFTIEMPLIAPVLRPARPRRKE